MTPRWYFSTANFCSASALSSIDYNGKRCDEEEAEQKIAFNKYHLIQNTMQDGHILAKMKFPEFSLCYINFPCVIFMQKLTINSINKGHITPLLLHTEA